MSATAEHRPATRRRRFAHDDPIAVDLFSGFGGLTEGIKRAGFTTIMAANHNRYKVEVHEANHPEAEHWIADLINPESSDYHSARDLPAGDLLVAGVTCFAAGSLVLARRGLVPIEDIRVGDEVWTHKSRWRPVVDTSAVERPTITVNATTPITCTPGHPFMAANATATRQTRRKYQPLEGARCLKCGGPAPRFRVTKYARLFCSRTCSQADANRRALPVLHAPTETRADDLAGRWVGTPILESDEGALPVIDGLGVVTPDLAWVIGRWVGDGWVSRRPERDDAWSRITICAGHAESDDLAKHLAALTDLPWNRTRKRTTDNFHVNRRGLADFLADNFGHGASAKRLPPWLLFAPGPVRRAFIEGYLSADGHESRDGLRVQAPSVSKQLAVAVRLLLTSLGYYAATTYVDRHRTATIEGRSVMERPQWVVTGHLVRNRRPKHRDRDEYRWGKPSGTVTAGEVVTVYNMTVAEDHTYVVDGVLVHNCTNHSQANTQKAYADARMSLFDIDDPDFESRVTRSERDRATANCFPAGTVVVARRGMVPIEELSVGDEVLTHRNRWRRVTGTMSRHAPLVTVKGRGHTELAVTANHRFLTRAATLTSRGWKYAGEEAWTDAGNLVGHAWQSPTEFPTADVPTAPDGWVYDHHFWWTVGRWLGDGWIRHCQPSGLMVGICCGYAERHELDGRWPTARVTEAATTVQYELRGSGTLARWLLEHFGERAHGKTVPTWALSMDAEYQKALVEGYMSADGCSSLGGRRGSCATVSRQLAVGMKLLLQVLGYRPTLGCRSPRPWSIEGRSGITKPMWVLQWMAEQRRASTIATIAGRAVGVVRSVTPAGAAEVFDIEVEEDHSFVADGVIVHNCVLHYAEQHRPRLILIECTTEFTSWGPAVPGRAKVGDGSTYRWWLKQFDKLDYRHKVLYLNSMFFGVPQSRDRLYIAFWDRRIPAPDLEHRPDVWCGRCDRITEGVWTWRTGVPPTGSVRYGKQYEYRCATCRAVVVPTMTPSLHALDLTDLGIRIGDKPVKKQRDGTVGPLAAATMARAERCRQRFADFPAVLMPAKSVHGSERHPWQPMSTQTSQQETAILSTGALMVAAGNTYERPGSMCRTRGLDEPLWTQPATNTTGLITPPVAVAVDNFQGAPRGVGEPLPTQVGSETLGLLSARVMPNRTNATSRDVRESMETIVGGAGSGGLGVLSSGVVPYRKNTISAMHSESMPTVTAEQIPGLLTATGLVGVGGPVDPTSAALMSEWRAALADLPLEDCYFRMMAAHEVGRGCGFDVNFPGYQGAFVVWGSARHQVDGFGNAVSPQVGEWIGTRLRAVLHGEDVAAA